MFEDWLLFLFPLGVFIIAGYALLLVGRRAPKPRKSSERKANPYMCGESLPDVVYASSGFYSAIRKALQIDKLKQAHTGRISDYLVWVLIGLTVIVLLMSLS